MTTRQGRGRNRLDQGRGVGQLAKRGCGSEGRVDDHRVRSVADSEGAIRRLSLHLCGRAGWGKSLPPGSHKDRSAGVAFVDVRVDPLAYGAAPRAFPHDSAARLTAQLLPGRLKTEEIV